MKMRINIGLGGWYYEEGQSYKYFYFTQYQEILDQILQQIINNLATIGSLFLVFSKMRCI